MAKIYPGKQTLNMFPWRVGVPLVATSGLEKWEAPDPAEWCQRGYVIVNVDARGAFNSEGDQAVYGTQVSIFDPGALQDFWLTHVTGRS